ncbi:MAG: TerB N-terminal domain-containing protein [Ruminococcus sp.]|jgi:hypothetical protein|nr:TerB N-terminal domain-containing protein [Ruminococcus sp.]
MNEIIKTLISKNGLSFLEKAKIAENYSESYEYTASIPSNNTPAGYEYFNLPQLKTYFTIRNKLRDGFAVNVSESYIRFYAQEVINGIGVNSPKETLSELAFLLFSYENTSDRLKKMLIIWIKHFYLISGLKEPFYDIVEEFGVSEHFYAYNPNLDSDSVIKSFFSASNYNPAGSIFVKEHPNMLYKIYKAFTVVMRNLLPFFEGFGISFSDCFGEKSYYVSSVLFPDLKYYLNINPCESYLGNERYSISSSCWYTQVSSSAPVESISFLCGYIIKKIENEFRIKTKFHARLRPDKATVTSWIEFSGEYYYNRIRRVVLFIMKSKNFEHILTDIINLSLADEAFELDIDYISSHTDNIRKFLKTSPYSEIAEMSKIKLRQNEPQYTAKLFELHSAIFKNITDDFRQDVGFIKTLPTFDEMSVEQIRAYLTFRTDLENDITGASPIAFTRIYIYEVLNDKSSGFELNFHKLAKVLKNKKLMSGILSRQLSTWLKEYYVLSDVNRPFLDIVKENDIEEFYPELLTKENILKTLGNVSEYKILKSKFISEKTLPLISKCIDEVFNKIDEYYRGIKTDFYGTLFPTQPTENVPLMYGAVFLYDKTIKNKRVEIAENEVYESYGLSYWVYSGRVYNAKYSSIILGFIFKYTEMRLRELTEFKTKLKVVPKDYVLKAKDKFKKDGYNFDFLRRGKKAFISMFNELENEKFLKLIDDVVFSQDISGISFSKQRKKKTAFVAKEVYVPVKVEIDETKLETIRQESEETLEKLIAADTENYVGESDSAENKEIEAENYESENNDAATDNNDNDIKFKALNYLMNGEINEFKNFSKSENLLPEVLIEEINEWALDNLGDNIIDDNYTVYEDYIDELTPYLKK